MSHLSSLARLLRCLPLRPFLFSRWSVSSLFLRATCVVFTSVSFLHTCPMWRIFRRASSAKQKDVAIACVIAPILSHATSHTHGRLLVVQLLTHAATTWMFERSLCTKSRRRHSNFPKGFLPFKITSMKSPDLKLIKNLTRLHKMFQCLAVSVLRSRGSQNNADLWKRPHL